MKKSAAFKYFFGPAPPAAPVSSAGIFDSNDRLVRTLWSAETNHANVLNPAAEWDGRLDDGTTASAGTYTAKVIRHNIEYTWEGVIGNTSPNHIDNIEYNQHATDCVDMTITTAGAGALSATVGEVYFIHGYDERWGTHHVTTEDDMENSKYVLTFNFRVPYIAPAACCTDSIITYFIRISGTESYIMGVSVPSGQIALDNPGWKTKVIFPFGVSDGAVNAALAYSNTGQGLTDIAVQKSGSFLFGTRLEVPPTTSWSITTLNKTSGQTLQVNLLGYIEQSKIATNPITGELWVIHSTLGVIHDKISKLTADGAGVLTETGVHITGLSDAYNLEVSPDGSTLLVTDDGTSQQIKAFNTSDGSVKTAFGTNGVFGQAGGYAGSPAVTDDKFMFKSPNVGFGVRGGGFIAFSPTDSSWWVGDAGNHRILHFSAGNSPTLIEKISWLNAFYSCHEFRGDPTRILSDFLEWKLDYDIPLAPNNGSWTLANNWFHAAFEMNQYFTIKWLGVYSNGLTYGFVHHPTRGWAVIELTSTGRRDTGVSISFQSDVFIDYDMNIWFIVHNFSGSSVTSIQLYRNAFTGFDGSNNPTWNNPLTEFGGAGADELVLTTPPIPDDFPFLLMQMNHSDQMVMPLSNGVIPCWNAHSFVGDPDVNRISGYHLGGLDSVTGQVKFMTHHATHPSWGGTADALLTPPEKPSFAVGWNGVLGAQTPGNTPGLGDFGGGSIFYIPGRDQIFTQYPGEEWGNDQTNLTSHWHETGLLLGQFGPTMPYFGDSENINRQIVSGTVDYDQWAASNVGANFKGLYGAGGNSFNGGLTFVNGKYYVFHNDEWYHGGVHRWRVDNADNLTVLTQPVDWDGIYVPAAVDPNNLLDGLPFGTFSISDNTAGWTRSPAADINTNYNTGPWFGTRTNSVFTNRFRVPDLMMRTRPVGAVTYSLTRTLPRVLTGNWSIDAIVRWIFANSGPSFSVYVLDNTGKKIIRLYNAFHETTSIFNFWVNSPPSNIPITPVPVSVQWSNYCARFNQLIISGNVSTGKLTVTYGIYTVTDVDVFEVGADITSPDKFQILDDNTPQGGGLICFKKLDYIEV